MVAGRVGLGSEAEDVTAAPGALATVAKMAAK